MKAIRVTEFGGPQVLRYTDVPAPVPADGEALIAVEAVGVNYADITSRIGLYKPALPWIPGNEASGVVLETRGESDIRVGDRVAWATAPAGLGLKYIDDPGASPVGAAPRDTVAATYAELAVAPLRRLVPLPDGISFETGAAVAMHGITAHYLAHSVAPLQPGDHALVHAGAGGVGLLLIQMLKNAGVTVYATASSEEKAAAAKGAGADHVINYTRDDFAAILADLTAGEGVRAVFDSVGQATFEGSFASLGAGGYLVVYGQASGPVPPFSIARLNIASTFITRPSIAHYTRTRKQLLDRAADVFAGLADGSLTSRVHAVYPLAEAAQAHQELESRRAIGKIILLPEQGQGQGKGR
jgi:NADPH2:quinone reductase